MTHSSPTTTDRLSIEHALTVTRGVFPTPRNQAILGSIGDSAPATWGRRLMQRSERRLAEKEKRPIGRLQRRTIRSALPMTPSARFASAGPTIRHSRRRHEPASLPLLN